MRTLIGFKRVVFAAVAAMGVTAFGETLTYVGGVLDWNDATSWKLPDKSVSESAPTIEDDVVISSGTVSSALPIQAKSITMTGGVLKLGDATTHAHISARIAGDLTASGSSSLYFTAGRLADLSVFTNEAQAASAIFDAANIITVGGKFTLGGSSKLYPENEILTGVPVLFRVGSFELVSGAQIVGDSRGWGMVEEQDASVYPGTHNRGNYRYYGFGTGWDFWMGAGHGGAAANKDSFHGRSYGYKYAPFLPGCGSMYNNPLRGGATVGIFATGPCVVNGSISDKGPSGGCAAASGGGVWLVGDPVTLGDNITISVVGGNGTGTYGSGSGGRVSIGERLEWEQIVQLAHGETPDDALYSDGYETYATINVSPGTDPSPSTSGGPGTITYVEGFRGRVKLTVDGYPQSAGSDTITVGDTIVDAGEKTFTSGDYGYDAAHPDTCRYAFAGYVVSNALGEVTRGDAFAAKSFTVDLDSAKGPYRVTWLWGETEVRRLVKATEPEAVVKLNGTPYAGGVDVWAPAGTDTLEAVPGDGMTFLGFAGDVPGRLNSRSETLEMAFSPGARVYAIFAKKGAELTDKTFTGKTGGSWDDPANWTPAGVPTFADHVKITSSKVCNADFIVEAGALTVDAGSSLRFCSKDVSYDVVETYGGDTKSAFFIVRGDVADAGAIWLGGHDSALSNLVMETAGDFTLTGSGALYVYAARTPDAVTSTNLYFARTEFNVGGRLAAEGTSTISPRCDPWTGTAVKISAHDFALAVGATVNANACGWGWYKEPPPDERWIAKDRYSSSDPYSYTVAPGRGTSYSRGGSYGGLASGTATTYLYGSAYAPFLPGSGSGLYGGTYAGGGVIWIEAEASLTVNGTMTAKGASGSTGASGGSIWLIAPSISGDNTAVLNADGATNNSATYSAGGGGRVSLGVGLTAADQDALALGEMPEDVETDDTITLLTATAIGGTRGSSSSKAGDGTVSTVKGPLKMIAVNVLGNPFKMIRPEPDYGGHGYPNGTTVTFTAPEFGFDPRDPEYIRWTCAGYVVSNLTDEVAHGAARTFDYTLDGEDITVYWLWDTREHRLRIDTAENGTVKVNGVALEEQGAWDTWASSSEATTVEAVPAEGCEFLYWVGEMPLDSARQNPLVYTADNAHRVKPVFRPAEAPTTRTWLGAAKTVGDWLDATKWSGGNLPGVADTVVIAQGTVVASNYLGAAAVTLSGANTRLFVGSLPASGTAAADAGSPIVSVSNRFESVQVEVTGDLVVSNGAQFALGAKRHDYRSTGMAVGGDFKLFNASKAFLVAGQSWTAEDFAAGSVVRVGGNLELNDTAVLMPHCETYSGGSLCFRVGGTFSVAEGAKVDAQLRGYDWWTTRSPSTLSPGTGGSYGSGASHGGLGESKSKDDTYGFALGPVKPGSAYGIYSNTTGPGGGLVRVHANRVVMLGTINANANGNATSFGSASGGGVWLTSQKKFVLSGSITAKGGRTSYAADGGGGRIALGLGLTDAEIDSIALTGEFPGKKVFRTFVATVEGLAEIVPDLTVSAAGGFGTGGAKGGEDGTVRYYDARPNGFKLIVR